MNTKVISTKVETTVKNLFLDSAPINRALKEAPMSEYFPGISIKPTGFIDIKSDKAEGLGAILPEGAGENLHFFG